ncbi:MAG: TIGR04282 family arsenosugar biosynthesis glycosyltransferase [Bryobacterales bacterium]
MSIAIVLFAKAPLPGRVKTRLSPPLSAGQAAGFHKACVCDAWETIAGLTGASPYLYSDTLWAEPPEPIAPEQVKLQHGRDLGDRMFNCFQELLEHDHSGILIVGSDCPSLPGSYLVEGLEVLTRTDAVLGPAEDGGYYAIGCRQPHPRMFEGVPWSSEETFECTEKSLTALGQSIHKLPPWYDVDTLDDLRRLAAEASLPRHVGSWISEHRGLLA